VCVAKLLTTSSADPLEHPKRENECRHWLYLVLVSWTASREPCLSTMFVEPQRWLRFDRFARGWVEITKRWLGQVR